MRYVLLFLLFLLLIGPAASQPIVSNITVSDISHSSVKVSWSNSVHWSNCRIRYGATTSYDQGALGGIQGLGNDNSHFEFGSDNQVNGCQMNLYLLKSSQTYHVCPQTTTDGTNWSDCVDANFTTAALPPVHPARPQPPATFSTDYPDTTGYTLRKVAGNCSDLQTHINAAAQAQTTAGSIIAIPPGTACTGQYVLPADTSVKVLPTATGVKTSTNTFTLNGHGFTDQQAVRIAAQGQNCSGGVWTSYCGLPGRWAFQAGNTYFIKRINANSFQVSSTPGGAAISLAVGQATVDPAADTITMQYDNQSFQSNEMIQFRSNGTLPAPLVADKTYYVLNDSKTLRMFKISATQGGPALNITSAGTGTLEATYPGNGDIGILLWPHTPNKIIIRSAAPDSALPPPNVRITPAWQPQMAAFQQTKPDGAVHASLVTSVFAHGYRIGPGIEFTYTSTSALETQSTVTGDYRYGVVTTAESNDIIFDRIYVHPPDRYTHIQVWAGWNGSNTAIINSYFDHLNYAHGGQRIGMAPSNDANHVTWTSGAVASNSVLVQFPEKVTLTVSNGAGATGTGCVWFQLSDRKMVVDLPMGVSAEVSGYSPYSVVNHAVPSCPPNGAWPLYGNGNVSGAVAYSVLIFQTIAFAGGNVTGTVNFPNAFGSDQPLPQPFGEGTQFIVAGIGPGPYRFSNNYLNSTGIPIHFDDSTGYVSYINNSGVNLALSVAPGGPADIVVDRNYFTTDAHTIFGKPGTDYNRYFNRNAFEVKNGTRGRLEGNIIERQFADVAHLGTGVVIQAVRGSRASDWEVLHNIYRYSGTGMLVMGAPPAYSPVGDPVRRMYIHNNLIYGLDGDKYQISTFSFPVGTGTISANYGGEDYRIEHNTVADAGSTDNVVVHFKDQGWEGFLMQTNFIEKRGAIFNEEATSCPGADKAVADCLLVAGKDISYTWAGNILSGGTSPTLNSATTSDPRFVDAAKRDYRLKPNSSLQAGSKIAADLGNVGADADAVSRVTAEIRSVNVSKMTQTDASVTATVPDKGAACIVGYGTDNNVGTWLRTPADTANSLNRNIALTGLTPRTTYNYQLWCAGTAPTETRQFGTN